MCVPVVTYNESCFYDSQCKATDWNLFCKTIIREDGLTTSDMSCDCITGYNWDSGDAFTKKCLAYDNDSKQEKLNNTVKIISENGTSLDQETTTADRELIIWWIFRPSESTGKCDN